MGARLEVTEGFHRRTRTTGPVALDVQADRRGEFFEVLLRPGAGVALAAVDVQPGDRHLLLLVREERQKHKFLCGHDERHWFVAAVPESLAGVGSVRTAKEALARPHPASRTGHRLTPISHKCLRCLGKRRNPALWLGFR
jgi:hypothetical protein